MIALAFPAIDPVAFSIGPVAVRWYGIAYAVGIAFAWAYMRRLAPKLPKPYSNDDVADAIACAAIAGIIGGRIGYVLFYAPSMSVENPLEILMIHRGGMAFHGGLIGAFLALALFARRRGVSVLSSFDLVAAAAPVGIALGRIANFVNGEIWGRPADVPWAVVFPRADDLPRHPSQIYEAMLEGVLLFVIGRVLTHRLGSLERPGETAGAIAVAYAIARSVGELFKAKEPSVAFLPDEITMGMLLSAPMVAVGTALVVRARRKATT